MDKKDLFDKINNLWFKDFVSINQVFKKRGLNEFSCRIISDRDQQHIALSYGIDITKQINDILKAIHSNL